MQHLFSDAPSPDELRGRQSQLQQTRNQIHRRRFEDWVSRVVAKHAMKLVFLCWAVVVCTVLWMLLASGRSR